VNEIECVLDFWFGLTGTDGAFDPQKRDMWFRGGRHHDREIAERFGLLHTRAGVGDLESWTATPTGRLALIVLLDQFSRHIHRQTAAAFAHDAAARRLALDAIAAGADLALDPAQRAFIYLPLEHAEDEALQRDSVSAFHRLRAAVGDAHAAQYDEFLDYALRHQAVIARFGRFPHRNAVLGRPSTPEEAAFLAQPGSHF